MKVSAVFMDYDGTIAPLDVERERSAVAGPLFSLLGEISSRIPVAVITSKDVGFVRPRTGFAWAWAGVLGLELRLRDGSGRTTAVPKGLSEALPKVKALLPTGVEVEEKRGTDGTLLGASIDWRKMREAPRRELESAERLFAGEGLPVHDHPERMFLDVYAAPMDKGSAFRSLAEMLGAGRPIMYLGDMSEDNDAFDAADIPICVKNDDKAGSLRCRYSVSFREVEGIFARLLADGLEFAGELGGAVS
ncbi:MAG: hydrolase [Nitrososphaerota archaeon]|nr:hydrolase [Nitrososphaerota archaeon]MDG6991029.1 hydrolase [Nitrososphaerota archaeon]